jgi:hypothetical protein
MELMKRLPTFFRGLCALIFFAAFIPDLQAQRYEFGGGVGVLNYKGDLNPHLNVLLSKPGIQAFARYNFSMAVVGRFNFMYGKLAGDGSLSPNVYISQVKPNVFSTDIFEFSGLMEYNFFNYRNPKNRFIFGSPYLFGGPSIFVFSPDPVEQGSKVSMVQPALLIGFGYKHQIGQFWNVGVEFGGRFCFTDYLDNVSDREVLTNMQRGNIYDKDVYTFLGINLSYTIKEVICPFIYQQTDDKK